MLSPNRDLVAAKTSCNWRCTRQGGTGRACLTWTAIRAYATAISELKHSGELGRRCRCRPSPYLNNVLTGSSIHQERIAASLWFRSTGGALNTIEGYESMHMIREGQIRWLARVMLSGRSGSSPRFTGSLHDRWPSVDPRFLHHSLFATHPILRTGLSVQDFHGLGQV